MRGSQNLGEGVCGLLSLTQSRRDAKCAKFFRAAFGSGMVYFRGACPQDFEDFVLATKCRRNRRDRKYSLQYVTGRVGGDAKFKKI